MSKHSRLFFEQLKAGAEPTLLQALKDAAVSLKEICGQLWDAGKPMFDHGRTELAAALFGGHAHVMYMKGQEGIEQGQDQTQSKANESPEIHRDGREL